MEKSGYPKGIFCPYATSRLSGGYCLQDGPDPGPDRDGCHFLPHVLECPRPPHGTRTHREGRGHGHHDHRHRCTGHARPAHQHPYRGPPRIALSSRRHHGGCAAQRRKSHHEKDRLHRPCRYPLPVCIVRLPKRTGTGAGGPVRFRPDSAGSPRVGPLPNRRAIRRTRPTRCSWTRACPAC